MRNILVTGIGGNVGYGILKNIRQYYTDIAIIGTNTLKLSPGNHLCDHVYEVPAAVDAGYIPAIKELCSKHNIELIIPSTDDEVYALALNRDELPNVVADTVENCKRFLDKYETHIAFYELWIQFAQSVLPSLYKLEFDEYIVKPRKGRGSRDIHITPSNPKTFSDEYIIQPLLKGPEITTAAYITKDGHLHGHITMLRELRSGYTQYCEVTKQYDAEIAKLLAELIENFNITGPVNIQSIVTDDGIIPFEINGRISGTNSIRSQFGFKDVCYTIDEYLYNKKPEEPVITLGSAIRILDDIIYPGISLKDINNNQDNFYLHT